VAHFGGRCRLIVGGSRKISVFVLLKL
jgi:hypothetical protein